MRHETVDYLVLSHFLPYIINGDGSGLDDGEQEAVDEFEAEAYRWASERPGFKSCHWSVDNDDCGDDFGRCEITQCFGGRSTLQLVIMLET